MVSSMSYYLAILVATVASFIFGWLWYGPLFGKSWMKLMKFNPNRKKSGKKKMIISMIVGFISTLITAYVLGLIISFFYFVGISSISINQALVIGFFIWIGFIGTTTLGTVLWENKPIKLYLLNNVYNLLNIELMVVILSLWH